MMSEDEEVDETCKMLELPYCVLRQICLYLDSTSLYQLSRTCQYFQDFIKDPLFWRYIDARKEPNSAEKIRYCCDRFHDYTTHALFRAKDVPCHHVIDRCGQVSVKLLDIFYVFSCTNLRVLALEKQKFIGEFSMKYFPECLEELSLKQTRFDGVENFSFQDFNRKFQNLRVLILDGCEWVPCSFLMSIAHHENLEIVSAVNCFQLHSQFNSYSIKNNFICKKLKVFDCRFSETDHILLPLFCPRETIQAFYFQNPKSEELDYGQTFSNNSFMYDKTLHPNDHISMYHQDISDENLHAFLYTMASDTEVAWPESSLYQDPYPKCTCKNNEEEVPMLGRSTRRSYPPEFEFRIKLPILEVRDQSSDARALVHMRDIVLAKSKSQKILNLRCLSLRGFRKITDISLTYLGNLKIDLLDLTYTSVTKEGIANFLIENPTCRIIHPLFCVCKPLNPFQ